MKTPECLIMVGAATIEQAEMDAVLAVIESGWSGTGPRGYLCRLKEEARNATDGRIHSCEIDDELLVTMAPDGYPNGI